MTDDSPSRSQDKIVIRVPDGLRERIQRAAKTRGLSTNAELVRLLELTYPPATRLDEFAAEISTFIKAQPDDAQEGFWRAIFERLENARIDRS